MASLALPAISSINNATNLSYSTDKNLTKNNITLTIQNLT